MQRLRSTRVIANNNIHIYFARDVSENRTCGTGLFDVCFAFEWNFLEVSMSSPPPTPPPPPKLVRFVRVTVAPLSLLETLSLRLVSVTSSSWLPWFASLSVVSSSVSASLSFVSLALLSTLWKKQKTKLPLRRIFGDTHFPSIPLNYPV